MRYFGFGHGPDEDNEIITFDGPFDIRAGDKLVTRDGTIHLADGDERRGEVSSEWRSVYVMDGSPTVSFGDGCVRHFMPAPSYSVALDVAERLNALFWEDTLLDEIEKMAKQEQK